MPANRNQGLIQRTRNVTRYETFDNRPAWRGFETRLQRATGQAGQAEARR